MKSVLLFLLVFVNSFSSFAQSAWKEKLIGRWQFEGTEEFGVLTVDSGRVGDWLEFTADGIFRGREKGESLEGSYTVDEQARVLSLKVSGQTRIYYLKKSDVGVLIIEHQTPDLVRTRNRFSQIK